MWASKKSIESVETNVEHEKGDGRVGRELKTHDREGTVNKHTDAAG
jgi:hypothetical protein